MACHTTAASPWSFDLRGPDAVASQPPHFLGPDGLSNRRVRGLQVHCSHLGTDDAVLHEGVRCTAPPRTARDVVRLGAPVDGLATLDAALRSGTCTRELVSAAAVQQAGLREAVRLSHLIPVADACAESPMESRMPWRFVAGGFSAPDLQVEVVGEGRRHRLDTGWREHRLGAAFEGSSRT